MSYLERHEHREATPSVPEGAWVEVRERVEEREIRKGIERDICLYS